MNILISGDFYISDAYQNKNLIDQSIIDLFDEADYRLVNLEAPVTSDNPKNKILKSGPHLRMDEDTILPYLNQLNVDAVTLANNHILDYGTKGLNDTIKSLKQNKINYVGAGNKLSEANQVLTLNKGGIRIAILNFCENEWSIATEKSAGANPLDIIDNSNQIKVAKETHDKVICIIHGGQLHYTLPTPLTKKRYRFFIDAGADAVISHHSHAINGYENYQNKPIYYGLGSFMFTRHKENRPYWYTGLISVLSISENIDENIRVSLYPVQQKKDNFCVNLLRSNKKNELLNYINDLNMTIADDTELNNKWDNFLNDSPDYPLSSLSPINNIKPLILKKIAKKIGLFSNWPNKKFKIQLLNILRCEAHREKTSDNLIKILNK